MGPEHQRLLDILGRFSNGLLAESLIRLAAAPADRPRVLAALRGLIRSGHIHLERQRSRGGISCPRVRLTVTQ